LGVCGQSIVTRLNELVTFESKSSTTEGQLLEFARRFQIPMGVELAMTDHKMSQPHVRVSNEPAINVLKQIVEHDGTIAFDVRDEVVDVYSTKYLGDLRNFLNIRLPGYDIKNESLSGAKYYLKMNIWKYLQPGTNYGGGYGGVGLNDDFDLRNITFSARNVTVREILNRLIAIQGNAIWIVRLKPAQASAELSFYVQATAANGDGTSADFYWEFVPLREIKQSNRERAVPPNR
jgi:hypothetical protein